MTSTAMAAARLLREYAEELKRSHTIFSSGAWPEGESEAKAAYEQHIVIASALEAMPAQCLYQIQETAGNHSEIPSSSVIPNNCAAALSADVAVPDEREAFEAKFKHLDLSRDRDAWMQEKYKHAAISLAWEAWQGRAALAATPADHVADAGNMVPASPVVQKWIDDPHDIEQGQMLNPEWVKAQETAAAPIDDQISKKMICNASSHQSVISKAAAPVVLPEPAVTASVKQTSATSWNVEFNWHQDALKQEGEHKLYTEQQVRALLAQAATAAAPALPADGVQPVEQGEVLVTVSGFTGCGKSAIAGEIEILCRALGLQVQWPDGDSEKNMTHADWTEALEQYKPRVRIVEQNIPFASKKGLSK